MVTSRVLFEWGPFSLDPVKRLLMRHGHRVPVPPRAIDVLLALLDRRGRAVDKDELLSAVWGNDLVEENNLSVSISALRKALGETTRDHRYIVTHPRRGYAFVASVTERLADERAMLEHPDAPARHRSPVLVAPFELLTDKAVGAAADAFARSISDGLAAALGSSQHLAVVTPLPPTRGKADHLSIGRRMRTDYVLVGSVRLGPARVRVMTRLLRTADGTGVWGTSFEELGEDLFSAEGRIVDRIGHGLAGHFEEELHQRSARRGAENAEAHRDYVRGRYFWNKRTEEGLRKAIDHFERAIHADPGYALPYAGLADCFLLLSTYGATSPRQGVPKAVRAATRALEIDDTLAEAYTSLAYARFAYYWQWQEAETYFRRAIQLSPDYGTGHHLYADQLAAMGRFDEAVQSLHTALALEPLSLIINTDLGWVLFHARRWNDGVDQLKKTIEMDSGFAAARWVLGLTWLHAGESAKAVTELDAARALAPHSPHILGSLAYALGVAARPGHAKTVMRELRELGRRQYVSPYHYAVAQLGAGAHDAAVRELRRAVGERAHWAAYFRVTPTLDVLREHSGFIRLLDLVPPLQT
ncbi:MAG: winged helix-turn-helix domain-containing protein [Acidobacteria bacterium]|nr:winged helix-turn-helix domain-containing protein [Acidobacteriota bacterium]